MGEDERQDAKECKTPTADITDVADEFNSNFLIRVIRAIRG